MTTAARSDSIDDLARTVRDRYGLQTLGAAASIVDNYIGPYADDDRFWDESTKTLADEGVAEVADAISAGSDQALLDALDTTAISIRERTAERDDLIRAALRTDLPRAAIAAAADLTEARLYQIRDRRR